MAEPLDLAHGALPLPAFLPDATRGVVRGSDAEGVRGVGVRGLMVNAFHLMIRPGADRVRRLGGLHRFIGWDGPIVTDSGGFQALSLIRENPDHGTVRSDGLHFRVPGSARKLRLTPERCVRTQFQLGSDVMIALDDCTDPAEPRDAQQRSVERTGAWAKGCRAEYERQIEQRKRAGPRPLLVGVVQGGRDPELRRQSAEALLATGFDGFGFGGFPVGPDGVFEREMFELMVSVLPPEAPRFALGVGKPEHVVSVARLGGRTVFDCTIPTRDARHHRLYTFTLEPGAEPLPDDASFYKCVYILDERHASDARPLEDACDCPCCRNYSRAYLHHLFKIEDPLAIRLATLHNLRFYARLLDVLGSP